MSYLVLARKWRPRTFEEVLGQPHVTRTLSNAIQSGRIAHAYLFTGARGVGKTSVARILAKSLNCREGVSSTPCGQCSNCREIARGNSPDVLEIDGASNNSVDDVRELRETVRYRPAKSPYKVYIIDEVHMLSNSAFNALLKTLEEPPDHVIFVFATTEPHRIPPTILSRCQRFDFRRIPARLIHDHLSRIAREEGADLSESLLYSIAREAEGGMRDAQSLLEQILVFAGDGLSDREMMDILGVVDRTSVHRVGRAVLEGDVQECLQVVRDLHLRGIDARRFCQQLCDHFRNLLFLSLGEDFDASWMALPRDEWDMLKEESKRVTPETLYLYFQVVFRGEEEIRRSSMPRLALEMLLLRLIRLPALESLQTVMDKLEGLEDRLDRGDFRLPSAVAPVAPAGEPAEPPAVSRRLSSAKSQNSPPRGREPGSPEESEPLPGAGAPSEETGGPAIPLENPEDIVLEWPRFLEWLRENDGLFGAKLAGSAVTKVLDGVAELEVGAIYEDSVSRPEGLEELGRLVRKCFGREYRWKVRAAASRKSAGGASRESSSRGSVNRLVLEDAGVQRAQEILGAELVEIRPVKSKKSGS